MDAGCDVSSSTLPPCGIQGLEQALLGLQDLSKEVSSGRPTVPSGRVQTQPYQIELGLEDNPNFIPLCRLLASVTDKDDVSGRSQDLLQYYGTLENIMRASDSDFPSDEILTSKERSLLQTVKEVSVRVLQEKAFRNSILNNTDALHDYLRMSLAHEKREVTRVIFLDSKYRLISDELHATGTLNHTPVYPRQIVKRAIITNAAALVVVHNHPSGDPSPSSDDVRMTKQLEGVLNGIDVKLIDHIIVGLRATASLRALGCIGEPGGA